MTRNDSTKRILKELIRSICMVHLNTMFSNLGLLAVSSLQITKNFYAYLSSSMLGTYLALIDYLVIKLTGILSTVRTMLLLIT